VLSAVKLSAITAAQHECDVTKRLNFIPSCSDLLNNILISEKMQNEAKCPQSRIAQDMYIHIFLQFVNLVFNMNRKKCAGKKKIILNVNYKVVTNLRLTELSALNN
jgi:hypothetical protein